MKNIPEDQVLRRLERENPWWEKPNLLPEPFSGWKPRPYLELFLPLVLETKVRRAVVLMGPRRVGKTVMIHHAIQRLMTSGVDPQRIAYFTVDHPLYNGLSLEKMLDYFNAASRAKGDLDGCFFFFDEIQYLRNWELHLKALVDGHPNTKFVVSGSAAAALKLKSAESGAGRFTEFLLPPLTFHEYLELQDLSGLVEVTEKAETPSYKALEVSDLNSAFVHYINFGGYPEVAFSKQIQGDPARFVKSDIIDKVLLRDLPSLYGVQDIQELNSLFTTLAFNTADEVSLEKLSQRSGVAKNTIKRYIEYLEAAFLIKTIHRVDRSARRFMRANFFKVYLTNPSIRSALFSPVTPEDDAMGYLVETAIFAQWFHSEAALHYARWKDGEVDVVQLDADQKPKWAVEVKWTDEYASHPEKLKSLLAFCGENGLGSALVTTRNIQSEQKIAGITLKFVRASLYCYALGHNIVSGKRGRLLESLQASDS
jgi:predicted AAA+ superfamily ATPase